MKAGDLVMWNDSICLVTEVYDSKCWRTDDMGKKINWGAIPYEPFVRLYGQNHITGLYLRHPTWVSFAFGGCGASNVERNIYWRQLEIK